MNKKLCDTVKAALEELAEMKCRMARIRNAARVLDQHIGELALKLEAVLDSEKSPEPPKSGAQ